MIRAITTLCLAAALAVAAIDARAAQLEQVVYAKTPSELKGYLCRPSGAGPFPAALFNHGGWARIIGGAPKETCQALADAGFVGFAPIRREKAESMAGQSDDVQAGLDYLRGRADVDRDRIAMIGFSRGGALTFMAAAQGAPIKAAVIMASAAPPARSGFNIADAGKIRIPVLLLVSKNDTGSKKTKGQNTIQTVQRMEEALKQSGNSAQLIIYPSFRSGDGHEMFEEIGDYWKDVVAFLKAKL